MYVKFTIIPVIKRVHFRSSKFTYQYVLWFHVLVDDDGVVVMHILYRVCNFAGNEVDLLICEL